MFKVAITGWTRGHLYVTDQSGYGVPQLDDDDFYVVVVHNDQRFQSLLAGWSRVRSARDQAQFEALMLDLADHLEVVDLDGTLDATAARWIAQRTLQHRGFNSTVGIAEEVL